MRPQGHLAGLPASKTPSSLPSFSALMSPCASWVMLLLLHEYLWVPCYLSPTVPHSGPAFGSR